MKALTILFFAGMLLLSALTTQLRLQPRQRRMERLSPFLPVSMVHKWERTACSRCKVNSFFLVA